MLYTHVAAYIPRYWNFCVMLQYTCAPSVGSILSCSSPNW